MEHRNGRPAAAAVMIVSGDGRTMYSAGTAQNESDLTKWLFSFDDSRHLQLALGGSTQESVSHDLLSIHDLGDLHHVVCVYRRAARNRTDVQAAFRIGFG